MLSMCSRILKHSYVLEHVSSVYAQSLSQGRWNSGRGAIKELRAMQVYKKQKNRYQLCLFLVSNDAGFKNNTINFRLPF